MVRETKGWNCPGARIYCHLIEKWLRNDFFHASIKKWVSRLLLHWLPFGIIKVSICFILLSWIHNTALLYSVLSLPHICQSPLQIRQEEMSLKFALPQMVSAWKPCPLAATSLLGLQYLPRPGQWRHVASQTYLLTRMPTIRSLILTSFGGMCVCTPWRAAFDIAKFLSVELVPGCVRFNTAIAVLTLIGNFFVVFLRKITIDRVPYESVPFSS